MARPGQGPRLAKNPRGLYEIRWTEQQSDGTSRSRRLSTGTASLQEANNFFAGWLLEFGQQSGRTVPTVEHVFERYLEEKKDEITDWERQRDAARMICLGFGDRKITDIDDKVLTQYKRDRLSGAIKGKRRRCTSDSTLRRELNALKAALEYARLRKRISADDVPFIKLPKDSEPAEFWITEDEADDLLRFAAQETTPDGRMTRAYRYLALGLGTAARKRSIQELTWYQVDLKAGLIRYDLNTSGKRTGGRTKKRKVPVPIANWLVPILERAKKEKVSEYVLDDTSDIRRQMDAVCKRAATEYGNPRFKKLNRHALRHSAATHMARAGVNLWELAGILGDTLQTVQKTYLHHCPDHLRKAINFRDVASDKGQTRSDTSGNL